VTRAAQYDNVLPTVGRVCCCQSHSLPTCSGVIVTHDGRVSNNHFDEKLHVAHVLPTSQCYLRQKTLPIAEAQNRLTFSGAVRPPG